MNHGQFIHTATMEESEIHNRFRLLADPRLEPNKDGKIEFRSALNKSIRDEFINQCELDGVTPIIKKDDWYEIIATAGSVKQSPIYKQLFQDAEVEKEFHWIKLLNANNPKYGYNKRLIVNSNLGIKLSEETKKKLSESHLGHKRSDESNKKIIESQYKKICQFDRDGIYIKTYNSLQDAAKELNCKYTTSITACLKKRLPSALGFLWCYEHEKDNFVPIETKKEEKIKSN